MNSTNTPASYSFFLRCKAFDSIGLRVHTITVYADSTVGVNHPGSEIPTEAHDIGPVLLGKIRKTAADSVTDDEIRALETDSIEAGDVETLKACIKALEGSRKARIFCACKVAAKKQEAKSEFAQLLVGRDVASLAGGLAAAVMPSVSVATVMSSDPTNAFHSVMPTGFAEVCL